MQEIRRLGLIAGNGRFPLLVLDEALKRGIPVTVAAVSEEASSEIERRRSEQAGNLTVHWVGLGQLGKLLKIFHEEQVDKAMMAGQVKHVRIFSREGPTLAGGLKALPDLRMLRLLWSLPQKNTESLIGAVANVLKEEGVELIDSTTLVGHLLAGEGVLTRRAPNREEEKDIEYGWRIAREIARLDLGQTIVIKGQAVVAVEAMEGTDETIRRAAALVAGQPLTVVKVSRPNQDMRFDIPVIGDQTIKTLRECNVSALALDAGKTLILDREETLREADAQGISLVGRSNG